MQPMPTDKKMRKIFVADVDTWNGEPSSGPLKASGEIPKHPTAKATMPIVLNSNPAVVLWYSAGMYHGNMAIIPLNQWSRAIFKKKANVSPIPHHWRLTVVK
jgi:hypothetical protein